MSTRCNIIVEDRYDRVQLYRHWDGYPDRKSGILATLEPALPFAWPLPRFEASDFAAAIVRAWKESGGGNIYIDGSPKGWELVHKDTEWVYLIRPGQSKRNDPDFYSGEPLVAVYDWHGYWFDKNDPYKTPPKPCLKVEISKARKAGLSWDR
ncbi:MAG: hypothetical protein MN733_10650 [Nitrososphaera sp.]|nr:hypothetical protein [Nitrososphaera sp.]